MDFHIRCSFGGFLFSELCIKNSNFFTLDTVGLFGKAIKRLDGPLDKY